MRTLQLALKKEYFDAIRDGSKKEEYRLDTGYWYKRIFGKEFDRIVLTWGYPKDGGDENTRLVRKWKGYQVKTITHPLFGNVPKTVFAIDVSEPM